MRIFIGRLTIILLICASILLSRGNAQAFYECTGKLIDASGVIGQQHKHVFSGKCSGIISHNYNEKVVTHAVYNFVGTASWNRKTGVAQENLKFTGDGEFHRIATGICTNDPFLRDPPDGKAYCPKIDVTVEIKSGELYNFIFDPKVFATKGWAVLAVAQGLSQENAQKQSAPPPPPPKTQSGSSDPQEESKPLQKPMSKPTPKSESDTQSARGINESARVATTVLPSLLNVEGEDLVTSGKILIAGGQIVVQPMKTFGSGWSGDGQLFWSGGSEGAVLDLFIEVPAAATYAMELYLTRAPDYGQLKIQVDGKDAPELIDAYAPRVIAPTPRQIGKFSLGQGERKISFMIAGKHPQATGYLVGIDRIRLYPVGAP